MNACMQGYDRDEALALIEKLLRADMGKSGFKALEGELSALLALLIDAHLSYLHVCGALDESGDTGEGEYDEDEAFEYLLDAVSLGRPEKDMGALAALIDAFLPAQDAYMAQAELVGE